LESKIERRFLSGKPFTKKINEFIHLPMMPIIVNTNAQSKHLAIAVEILAK
jgi:hypothetical protein